MAKIIGLMILLVGIVGITMMGLSMSHIFIEETQINESSSMRPAYNMTKGATQIAWFTAGWSPYIVGLALLIAMALVVFSVGR